MPARRLRGIAISLVAALIVTACATSTNLLTSNDIAAMRIDRVDIKWKPDAQVIWDKPQREFVERELAKKGAKKGPARPAAVTDAMPGATDAISAEYNRIADSPEAKAHVRETISRLLKQKLEAEVVPQFKGTRPVVLEIEVLNFSIPSAAQRIVLGGQPMVGAYRVLKDARSGAELAKLDQLSAGYAGSGVLGVAIDQAGPDLEERVVSNFVQQTKTWLSTPSGGAVKAKSQE